MVSAAQAEFGTPARADAGDVRSMAGGALIMHIPGGTPGTGAICAPR